MSDVLQFGIRRHLSRDQRSSLREVLLSDNVESRLSVKKPHPNDATEFHRRKYAPSQTLRPTNPTHKFAERPAASSQVINADVQVECRARSPFAGARRPFASSSWRFSPPASSPLSAASTLSH